MTETRRGPLQIAIILLTLATAGIHLLLAVTSEPPFTILFGLNALGYVTLLIALYFVPQLAGRRSIIRWLFILFASGSFVLYFVFNWPDVINPLGLITKSIELVLIILLIVDGRQS